MSRRARNAALRRTWLSLLLLIPFAIGSQRCMVGALGYGGAMRCLAIPTASAQSQSADCCHGPAGASKSDAPTSDLPTRSCCIQGAPVPEAMTLAVSAEPVAVAAATTPEAPSRGDEPATVEVEPDESPPPAAQAHTPQLRAPPRA